MAASSIGHSDDLMAVAVIVAGGTGERFGQRGGKQLASVCGLPVLSHTLRAFDLAESIAGIVVVVPPERVVEYRAQAVAPLELRCPAIVVAGGDTRQESVRKGIAAVSEHASIIVVHDGARPLVTPELIDETVAVIRGGADGVVVGHPAFDTLKIAEDDVIMGTPDRSRYWIAQTPQAFRATLLRKAYAEAEQAERMATDDSALVEAVGATIQLLEGPRTNLKVTVAEDLDIVEALLGKRGESR